MLTILANLLPISISILSDENIGDTVTDTFAKNIGVDLAILLPLLLPILIVVVSLICTHIFISWPFLVTKTIFNDECHTQQRNMKVSKVFLTNFKLQQFRVTLHCSDSVST